MAGDEREHNLTETLDILAKQFQLTEADRSEVLRSGQSRFYNRLGWSITYLKKAKLLTSAGLGQFSITDRGKQLLATTPTSIDISFLENNYPEMSAFRRTRELEDEAPATFDDDAGQWLTRASAEDRIVRLLENISPNEEVRLSAFRFLALAIELADEERGNAWYIKETNRGVRLMTGRLLALSVSRLRARIGVLGPISDQLRQDLSIDSEHHSEIKFVPGGMLLTLPLDQLGQAQELLSKSLAAFVEGAMNRVRRAVNLDDHCPEAVNILAKLVGRELPQPVPDRTAPDTLAIQDDEEDDTPASREPRTRGRAPIFEPGQRSIASLLSDIEQGQIALPDLQRQFVWEDTGARQLLNSFFSVFLSEHSFFGTPRIILTLGFWVLRRPAFVQMS